MMQPTSANSATQNESPALQTETGKTVSQNIPNPVPNIPSFSMTPPTSANSATQNISPALQTKIGKIVSQNIPNPIPNIPNIMQPNTANSATHTESPDLETEIEKEAKKKMQCQHCSEVINKKYITSHADKCQFYVKFIRNGLECSICSKRFERRRDLNQHLGHNHREIVFLNQSSKAEIEKERKMLRFRDFFILTKVLI